MCSKRAMPKPESRDRAQESLRSRGESRRDLDCIFREGVSWSVMVGIGETYLAAFALAIGAPEAGAGLVSSLPLLAGGVLQLLTPFGVRRLGSRRRWVVWCAGVQAGTFLPLILFAVLGDRSLDCDSRGSGGLLGRWDGGRTGLESLGWHLGAETGAFALLCPAYPSGPHRDGDRPLRRRGGAPNLARLWTSAGWVRSDLCSCGDLSCGFRAAPRPAPRAGSPVRGADRGSARTPGSVATSRGRAALALSRVHDVRGSARRSVLHAFHAAPARTLLCRLHGIDRYGLSGQGADTGPHREDWAAGGTAQAPAHGGRLWSYRCPRSGS